MVLPVWRTVPDAGYGQLYEARRPGFCGKVKISIQKYSFSTDQLAAASVFWPVIRLFDLLSNLMKSLSALLAPLLLLAACQRETSPSAGCIDASKIRKDAMCTME